MHVFALKFKYLALCGRVHACVESLLCLNAGTCVASVTALLVLCACAQCKLTNSCWSGSPALWVYLIEGSETTVLMVVPLASWDTAVSSLKRMDDGWVAKSSEWCLDLSGDVRLPGPLALPTRHTNTYIEDTSQTTHFAINYNKQLMQVCHLVT